MYIQIAAGGCTEARLVDVFASVLLANAGDSRTIVIRDETVQYATTDHTASSVTEKQRIESAGWRVEGGQLDGRIASSRGFGHGHYKQVFFGASAR